MTFIRSPVRNDATSNKKFISRQTLQKPMIVVIGATGQQGGGCLDALLKQGKFTVRAMTRDVHSNAAKAICSRGVEVVSGTLDDQSSLVKVRTGVLYVSESCKLGTLRTVVLNQFTCVCYDKIPSLLLSLIHI